MQKNSWKVLIEQCMQAAQVQSWSQLEPLLIKVQPDWQTLRTSMSLSSWQEVPTSDFWLSMPLSQQSLERSEVWQRIARYFIAHTLVYDADHTKNIGVLERSMLTYLPSLELAFHDTTFNHLRMSDEMLHLSRLLNQSTRTFLAYNVSCLARYFIKQCLQRFLYYAILHNSALCGGYYESHLSSCCTC